MMPDAGVTTSDLSRKNSTRDVEDHYWTVAGADNETERLKFSR